MIRCLCLFFVYPMGRPTLAVALRFSDLNISLRWVDQGVTSPNHQHTTPVLHKFVFFIHIVKCKTLYNTHRCVLQFCLYTYVSCKTSWLIRKSLWHCFLFCFFFLSCFLLKELPWMVLFFIIILLSTFINNATLFFTVWSWSHCISRDKTQWNAVVFLVTAVSTV